MNNQYLRMLVFYFFGWELVSEFVIRSLKYIHLFKTANCTSCILSGSFLKAQLKNCMLLSSIKVALTVDFRDG